MNHDLLNWPGGVAAAALLAVIGAGLLRLTRDHRGTLSFQLPLFLAAYALRLAAGAAIYGGGLLHIIQDEDSRGWIGGVTFMQRWIHFGISDSAVLGAFTGLITTENRGYQSLLGVFFTMTRLAGRMPATAVAAFAGALGIVLTYRTAELLATERAARLVGIAAALLPIMIVWASQTIKEPVVIALEAS